MSVLYMDASAIVKLAVEEEGSQALRREVGEWPELASTLVSRVEVPRAVHRLLGYDDAVEKLLEAVLDGIAYLDVDLPLTAVAARLDPTELRSLDAIHLASALAFGADLGAVATYDGRLAEAARKLGLPVINP